MPLATRSVEQVLSSTERHYLTIKYACVYGPHGGSSINTWLRLLYCTTSYRCCLPTCHPSQVAVQVQTKLRQVSERDKGLLGGMIRAEIGGGGVF